MEQTSYVMIKPEFANNALVVFLIRQKLIHSGLEIKEESYIKYDKKRARQHYAEHIGKEHFPNLEKYITSDKAYGMVVSGENAIQKIRGLCGSTKNPEKGTIRFDIPALLQLPIRVPENVVHSSDSPEAATREIKIFHELKKEYAKNEQTK